MSILKRESRSSDGALRHVSQFNFAAAVAVDREPMFVVKQLKSEMSDSSLELA
jgi:hypothetical protein